MAFDTKRNLKTYTGKA